MNEIVARAISGACFLALRAGATEIDLEHLLNALDMSAEPRDPSDEIIRPVPHRDFPLSRAAQSAIEKLMALDVAKTDVPRVRDILVAAKEKREG
jgi:hypothetical protein